MEYNSQLPYLIMPEYGRHIQKMIEYCIALPTKEERNKCARGIVDVMGQLNPHLRDYADFKHKLWDHLFIISDFKLDVDSPYPIPERESFQGKPDPLPYPHKKIKYKHYGLSVEAFIEKCINTEDPAQREEFTEVIANLMKKSFLTWNRDSVNDEVVLDHMEILSKGKLKLKENTNLRATHEILSRNRNVNNGGEGSQGGGGGKNKHKKKHRRHH